VTDNPRATPPPGARRAANVMLTLGILAALATVVIGGFGVVVFSEKLKSGYDWGGLQALVAMIAGAIASMWLVVALGLLVTQGFVRSGSPRACAAGIFVTAVAAFLPTAGLGILWAGNDPSVGQLATFTLALAVWLAPHAWIIVLLRKSRIARGVCA
jgi:hypothetical protein